MRRSTRRSTRLRSSPTFNENEHSQDKEQSSPITNRRVMEDSNKQQQQQQQEEEGVDAKEEVKEQEESSKLAIVPDIFENSDAGSKNEIHQNEEGEREEGTALRSVNTSPLHVEDSKEEEPLHPLVSSDSTNPVRSDLSENDNESCDRESQNSSMPNDENDDKTDVIHEDRLCSKDMGNSSFSIQCHGGDDETCQTDRQRDSYLSHETGGALDATVTGDCIEEANCIETIGESCLDIVSIKSAAQHEVEEINAIDSQHEIKSKQPQCGGICTDNIVSLHEASLPNEVEGMDIDDDNYSDEDTLFYSFDEIKLEIYRECLKSYRGRGPEKRFSQYWEQLGLYMSSALSAMPNIHSRLRSYAGPGSIDHMLNSFLTTRRLRQLHNTLILDLIKQSMENKIERDIFESIAPNALPVSTKIEQPFTEDVNQFKEAFHTDSGVWYLWNDCCDESFHVLPSGSMPTVSRSWLPGNIESSGVCIPSNRLPGVLVVENVLKSGSETRNISASDAAIWLIVTAAREYTSSLLQNIVNENKARQKSYNVKKSKKVCNLLAIETTRITKSQRNMSDFKLNSIDLAHAVVNNTQLAARSPLALSLSKYDWERCMHTFNSAQRILVPPNFKPASLEFLSATEKEQLQQTERSCNDKKDKVDATQHASENISMKIHNDVHNDIYLTNGGIEDKSSLTVTKPSSDVTSTLENDQNLGDKGSNMQDQSTILVTSEQVAIQNLETSVHSPSPRIGGRGKGKDLAALRIRRSAQSNELSNVPNTTVNRVKGIEDDRNSSQENPDKNATHLTDMSDSSAGPVSSKGKSVENIDTLRQKSLVVSEDDRKISEKRPLEEIQHVVSGESDTKRTCQREGENIAKVLGENSLEALQQEGAQLLELEKHTEESESNADKTDALPVVVEANNQSEVRIKGNACTSSDLYSKTMSNSEKSSNDDDIDDIKSTSSFGNKLGSLSSPGPLDAFEDMMQDD